MGQEVEPSTDNRDAEAEINALYAAGAHLSKDPEALAKLRELQQQEVAQIKQQYFHGLSLPIGEGERLLNQADELIKQAEKE